MIDWPSTGVGYAGKPAFMTAVAEFRIKLQPQPDVPALVVMRTRAPVLFDVVFIDYSDYGCSVKDKIMFIVVIFIHICYI
jgi:hypothetical protein